MLAENTLFRFAQDVAHIDEGYMPTSKSTSRTSFSLAGFQVTLIGRFWVTAGGTLQGTLTRSRLLLHLTVRLRQTQPSQRSLDSAALLPRGSVEYPKWRCCEKNDPFVLDGDAVV